MVRVAPQEAERKAREVVFAAEKGKAFFDEVPIHGVLGVGQAQAVERGGGGTREERVAVPAQSGVASRVEVEGARLGGDDANVGGEAGVAATANSFGVDGLQGGADAGDLGKGVDPGVGAACTVASDGVAEKLCERLFEGLLDGGGRWVDAANRRSACRRIRRLT